MFTKDRKLVLVQVIADKSKEKLGWNGILLLNRNVTKSILLISFRRKVYNQYIQRSSTNTSIT